MSNVHLVLDLSSWRYSFEAINRELELAKKKKQALDELLATGKISQPTYETLDKELSEALSDLESYQKSLIEKMKTRASNLEKQINILELFLANLEIHHAAGEIDDESYNRQNQAITLGLEATKEELKEINRLLTTVTPAEKPLETPEVRPEASIETETIESSGAPEVSEAGGAIKESSSEEVTLESVESQSEAEAPPEETRLDMPQKEGTW